MDPAVERAWARCVARGIFRNLIPATEGQSRVMRDEDIIAKISAGTKVKSVARTHGLSIQCVYKILGQHHIDPPSKAKKP